MSIFSSKSMRRFIFKVTAFVFAVAIISLTINYLYIAKNPVNSKFTYVPENIEVCNLGSSHGMYGYCYEKYKDSYTCFNFALDSQSLSYDYRLLKAYRENLSEDAIVIITLSYASMYGSIAEADSEDFESKNQRYYHFLPVHLIKKYDLTTDMLLGRYRSMKGEPTEVLNSLLTDPIYNTSNSTYSNDYWMKAEDVETEYWYITADAAQTDSNAEAAYLRHFVTNKQDENGNMIYNMEEVDALYNIIELCHETGKTPVLITTPYLTEYTDCIQQGSPDFYEEFYSFVDKLVEEENIQYYDYSHDERFQTDYDLFINADHLNKKGAKKFTACVWDEVISSILHGK